jgi:nucleoside-diphosphate-sugar epimerase
MAKILVTGGAGYIGSVLTPLLLREGHEVTVLDNFLYRQTSLIDCCANDAFHVLRGDCRDEALVRSALDGQDVVIPLAAIVGFPACDNDKTAARTINQDAVEMLLRLKAPEQKVIFPCTNSGYGLGQGQTYCTETSPINPITLYGRTKMAAEAAVLASGNAVAFRFATLFGASPRMRTDLLVNDFVYRAVFDRTLVVFEGTFMRNYLHVRDAANAFLFAVNHFDEMKGQTFNCGLSDANLSKLELCAKIKEHIPSFVYLQAPVGEDPDKRNYLISNEKIERLGYRPQYSLDFGIEELVKVYAILKKSSYGNA